MGDKLVNNDDDIRQMLDFPLSSEPDRMEVIDDGLVLNENVDGEADDMDSHPDFVPSDESAVPSEVEHEDSIGDFVGLSDDKDMVSVHNCGY